MFEKEADFAETEMLIHCHGDYSKNKNYREGWQEGAEFGYNKAKEEMQEQGLALQSDMDKTIEQNIALKKQIEKMKCCYNCQKDCGSIDRRICFDNNFKYWELRR